MGFVLISSSQQFEICMTVSNSCIMVYIIHAPLCIATVPLSYDARVLSEVHVSDIIHMHFILYFHDFIFHCCTNCQGVLTMMHPHQGKGRHLMSYCMR